jgi:polysaccharide chain length determinant protein (PEP-CTERM system associated)
MLPGKTYTRGQIASILFNRKWIILVPLSLGAAVAPYLGSFVPPRYKSESTIRVIPQRVPDNYVKSNVTTSLEDRLPAITDVILSQSSLGGIIQKFDLYKESRSDGRMDDAVRVMREKDIDVTLKGKDAFQISYSNTDPALSQRVNTELASLYVNESARERENVASGTNTFLESQLEDARQRLVAQEKKLASFQREHSGQLPSQLQTNLQGIQNSQMQLQTLGDADNRLHERRLLLERQIGDLRQTASMLPPAAGPIEQQLEAARTELAQDKLRYKSDHPDIRALERKIEDLTAELKAQSAPSLGRPPTPAELTQARHLRDLQDEMASVDRELDSNRKEEQRLKSAIGQYESRVDATPSRESDLTELTRDYSTLRTQYDGLLAKREESRVVSSMEQRQISEQFKILDPASLPRRPANQQVRIGIMSLGAVAGFLLGLLVVTISEFMDTSFRREEDVVRALNLPVMALVPRVFTDNDKRTRRLKSFATNLAGVAVVLASLSVLALWNVKP